MLRRRILAAMISVLMLPLFFGTKPYGIVVASQSMIRKVPQDYLTIQAAINAASSGDVIQVSPRTYPEILMINKTVHVVGEDRSATIIDGEEKGTVITITALNVEVSGFTIKNGRRESPYCGILVFSIDNVTISNNIVTDNYFGIDLRDCDQSTIFDNTIANNSYVGISVRGNNNIFYGNTIANNTQGVLVSTSTTPNTFYHNNFLNNTNQALFYSSTKWDNGVEGNFWSDYQGSDGNGDGIGDTTYPYEGGWDKCPLMEPWSLNKIFPINRDGETCYVIIRRSCIVASFNLNVSAKQLSFRVTGPSGSMFFFNITIPKTILNKGSSEKWLIQLNSTDVTANSVVGENASAYFIFLMRSFSSSYEIRIQIVKIPIADFSVYLIIGGVATTVITIGVAVVMFKRKRKKTSSSFTHLVADSFAG